MGRNKRSVPIIACDCSSLDQKGAKTGLGTENNKSPFRGGSAF